MRIAQWIGAHIAAGVTAICLGAVVVAKVIGAAV